MGQRAVELYDTTLRDGTQGEGINFSVLDKLDIARVLVSLGIHYIEGGWPGSNPKDIEFFQRVGELPEVWARVAAFGSTCRKGVPAAEDRQVQLLIESGAPTVTIFGKTWSLHVERALRTTREENLRMIRDTVATLVAAGRRVIYDAEHFFDGYQGSLRAAGDSAYALETLRTAWDAGAECLVLCDTNGGTLPQDVARIVREVRSALPEVRLGIHTHNDSGCAVANALLAVAEGCCQVQGTINGYGERCGNANLCSIIPSLQIKLGCDCLSEDALRRLTWLSRYVDEIANVTHDDRQAYVGGCAFAHKGGIHVSAVQREGATYEHVPPETVGNAQRVLVSELAGVSNLREKFRGLLGEDPERARAVLDQIKQREHEGYSYEAAEASLDILIRKLTGQHRSFFERRGFRVISGRYGPAAAHERAVTEAIVRVGLPDGTEEHVAADGDGPVNALDRALRKALYRQYPVLSEVTLEDFKVRIVNSAAGTAAKVRVLIEWRDHHEHRWATIGVSENIIEASWDALVDGIDYKLQQWNSTQSETRV